LKKRKVAFEPDVTLFMPSGVPRCRLDTVVFGRDEIEALRLTDLEGMYQDQAAEAMGISRQTLGNILASARHKASRALVLGKAIRIGEEGSEAWVRDRCEESSGCRPESAEGCRTGTGLRQGCGKSANGGGGCLNRRQDGCGAGPERGCDHGGRGCSN